MALYAKIKRSKIRDIRDLRDLRDVGDLWDGREIRWVACGYGLHFCNPRTGGLTREVIMGWVEGISKGRMCRKE